MPVILVQDIEDTSAWLTIKPSWSKRNCSGFMLVKVNTGPLSLSKTCQALGRPFVEEIIERGLINEFAIPFGKISCQAVLQKIAQRRRTAKNRAGTEDGFVAQFARTPGPKPSRIQVEFETLVPMVWPESSLKTHKPSAIQSRTDPLEKDVADVRQHDAVVILPALRQISLVVAARAHQKWR